MEDKEGKNLARPHVIDGITEYDNPLPRWWIILFVTTIFFGVVYMVYYHLGGGGKSLEETLQADLSKAQEHQAAPPGGEPGETESTKALSIVDLLADSSAIEKGKAEYSTYCTPCHLNDMGGQIGPNLVDAYWLHGCTPEKINASIVVGIPAKGMAAWGPILGTTKIAQITAYILTLQGSTPAKAKAAQGEQCQWSPP